MADERPAAMGALAAVRSRLFDAMPDRALFALLAYQHRFYEPELGRLEQLGVRGAVAVDVGAWWGPWTYWLSRIASEVVTFEPIPHLAAFLDRVRPANVRVLDRALSDRDGEAVLWVPARGRGSEGVASIARPARGTNMEISVRTMRLDDLHLEHVGLIKIDVEGHELAVLRGSAETIRRCRPTMVVEVEEHDAEGGNVHAVFDHLTDSGYTGRFLLRGRWHPLADFDLTDHQLRWQADIRRHGYVRNMLGSGRHYVNNFVFSPEPGS